MITFFLPPPLLLTIITIESSHITPPTTSLIHYIINNRSKRQSIPPGDGSSEASATSPIISQLRTAARENRTMEHSNAPSPEMTTLTCRTPRKNCTHTGVRCRAFERVLHATLPMRQNVQVVVVRQHYGEKKTVESSQRANSL